MDTQVKQKLDKFFSGYPKQKYKKGAVLIEPGVEPQGVYYLTSGIIKRYAISVSGNELIINTYKAESFFPMEWVLSSNSNDHYYETLSEAEVYIAPSEQFLKFFKNDSIIMFDLICRIYKGLDGYFTRMEYLLGGTAKSKLINELLIFSKRFGTKLKLTEEDLASETGLARETISRELIKLERKGLIEFKKHILLIPNLEKLEEGLN